jgi:branched-subunit amino acid transport protein
MNIWLVILGMALVTFAIRFLPFIALDEESLPGWARRGLNYVPVAVLTAISVPEFLPHEDWGIFTVGAHLPAGLVAILVAWYSKSTILTIAAGMAVLLLFS